MGSRDEDPDDEVELAEQVVEIPIDGELDLHNFHPRDIKTLVPDYLEECQKRGILTVRIIHGKGTGALKKGVHALLDRDPRVVGYSGGDLSTGNWGQTVVELKPTE